jgi:hypothetical protein
VNASEWTTTVLLAARICACSAKYWLLSRPLLSWPAFGMACQLGALSASVTIRVGGDILHTRTIREEAHHRVVVLIQLLGQQRPNFDKRTVCVCVCVCGQPARPHPAAGVRLIIIIIIIIITRFDSFRYNSSVPVEAGATAGGESLQHCIVGARSQAADGRGCVS